MSRHHFFLKLVVYPFGLFAFEPMGRGPARRPRRNGVVQEVAQSSSGTVVRVDPECGGLPAEDFSPGSHVLFRKTFAFGTFAET